ncbi:sugar ABC transporter permease [Paenibacillus sp. LHD-117]|uniref:carbohydrate ABC transporter permease n=1 Tax=Paenibacillus sp. LHD-117 TaxID=3071412 RepID=UPI0027DF2070|nr:sugar ABC transporter permease [Paenibacillus sp. LHD-117]MDQ6423132.1 sugar ABC transporter permease [Paenibacillus sp. LHD-117]
MNRVSRAVKQYIQVAPFLVLGFIMTCVFVLYPLVKGIHISFFEYKVIKPEQSVFLGFDNYKRLFNDPNVWIAFRNTVLFAIVTVPGQWALGILAAMIINLQVIRFKVFFRLVYYLPVISSWIVVSYLFQFLFSDGSSGIINYLLTDVLRIAKEPIAWLQNTWSANVVIWMLSIWKGVGWVMIMYLAALQSIPKSLYEAAQIDGARGPTAFIHITLPLMRTMTAYVVINLIIGAFQAFIQVFLITKGGPLDSTHLINTYMFKHAFEYFDFGYGAAISVMLGLLIFVITYGNQRTFGKDRIEY